MSIKKSIVVFFAMQWINNNFIPARIEAFFEASFHLIEFHLAKMKRHINKHQLVRKILEENPQVFGENTEKIWRTFQDLETRIRPAQLYGSAVDGDKLRLAEALFNEIRNLCGEPT